MLDDVCVRRDPGKSERRTARIVGVESPHGGLAVGALKGCPQVVAPVEITERTANCITVEIMRRVTNRFIVTFYWTRWYHRVDLKRFFGIVAV